MRSWIKEKYSGQAIAIIMVLLVVATIIGFSIYSRMESNREVQVETKESTMALSQADTLLRVFTSSDLATVQEAMNKSLVEDCLDEEEGCVFNGIEEITEALILLSLEYEEIYDNVDNWCEDPESPVNATSNIKLTMTKASSEDFVTYTVGDVFALNTKDLTFTEPCSVELFVEGLEASEDEVFTVKEVFMDTSGNVKPYSNDPDDMLLYSIGPAPEVAPTGSVEMNYPIDGANITALMSKASGSYKLYEYRLIPLKGNVEIAIDSISAGCAGAFTNYKIVATVTCNNEERSKKVIIPSANNSGYEALFDYTIYNEGATSLQPY